MRRGGTPMSLASRYWVMPFGLRNSSSRISPGVILLNSLLFIISGSPQSRTGGHSMAEGSPDEAAISITASAGNSRHHRFGSAAELAGLNGAGDAGFEFVTGGFKIKMCLQ